MTRLRPERSAGASAARLATFNAAVFLVIGIQLPFWPIWLAGHGLDAPEIAAVFAAAIWAKVAATPAIGALADRIGRRRIVMAGLAMAACVFYAALWRVTGFWPLLVLNGLAGVAQSALLPLGDAVTLAAVRERGYDYGRIRVWGSISFIAASVGGGAVLALLPAPEAGPDDRVLAMVLAASALLFAACLAIPSASRLGAGAIGSESTEGPGTRRRRGAVGRLVADRRFRLLVVSAAALQASHQLYYGFGTLYWRELGFSDTVIGILWAEGVVAEIVLFWYGAPLAARVGPLGLLALGGVGGIVRWSLMGLIPGLGAAAALQLLHALTFGASHLGAMYMLARSVPPGAAASAQSLYAALSAGLGSGLVMLGAGALYAAYGGQAYLFMAGLSAAGLVGVWRLRRAGTGETG